MAGENVPDLTINNLNVPSIRGFSDVQNKIEPITFNDTLKIFSGNDIPDANDNLNSYGIGIYDEARKSFLNIFSDAGTLIYNEHAILDSNNIISELNYNIDDFELVVNTDTNSLDYLNVSNLKILGNNFSDRVKYVTLNDPEINIWDGADMNIAVKPLANIVRPDEIIIFPNKATIRVLSNSNKNDVTIHGVGDFTNAATTLSNGDVGYINEQDEFSVKYYVTINETDSNKLKKGYTGSIDVLSLVQNISAGNAITFNNGAQIEITGSSVIGATSITGTILFDNITNGSVGTFFTSEMNIYNIFIQINDANAGNIAIYDANTNNNPNTLNIHNLVMPLDIGTNIVFSNGAVFTLTTTALLNSTSITGKLYTNNLSDGLIGQIQKAELNPSLENPYLNFTPQSGEIGYGLRFNNLTGQVQYRNVGGNGWINISSAFLDIKLSCVIATTIDLGAVYYPINPNNGVDSYIQNNEVGAFPEIDGVTLNTTGQRILVKNQTNQQENGIYQLSIVGDGTTPWRLTRATDADTTAKLNAGAFTVIESGLLNKGKSFTFLPNPDSITDPVIIGVTPLEVTLVGSNNAITEVNFINPGTPTDNRILTVSNQSNTIMDAEANLTFDGTNLVVVGNTKTNTVKSQFATTGLDIQFDGETTKNKITLTDNLGDALNITENTNSYMKFITTDGSEQIVFGQNSTFTGTTIADLGTVTTALFTDLSATNLLVNREEENITSSGAQTYLIANLKKGLIRRDCGGSSVSDIIDTAANIVAGLTGAQVGTSFEFVVENNSDSDETITITSGSGITLYGNMTIKQNKAKSFLAVITNIGSGTEAVSIYQLGGGGGDLNDLGDVELNTNKNGTYGLPVYGPDQDGNANQALIFDGLDDYVNIPYSFSDIKSVSIWFYPTSVSQQTIIYLNSTTYIEINGSSQINAQGFISPTIYVNNSTSPSTLSINNWYHVVVTTATGITTVNPFFIGKGSSTFFTGSISDVRLYNSVLNQTNVNDIYDNDNNIIGLELSHYKFDQATDSANIAVDHGNFNYLADIITSPGYTTDSLGAENEALSFNGTNNYVNIPHIVSGIKSISLRIKADNVTQQQILVYLNSTTYIEINGSSQINAQGFTSPTIYVNNSTSPSTLSINNWYHVVVTTETAIATDNPFYFAKGATTYYFNGAISDIRFHNSILNVNNITLLNDNDNNIIGNEIVHYRMNEGNNSNVNDSVNSNLYIANTPSNAIVGKANFNSSIGIQALNNIQIGEDNLAIGYQSLNSLVNGNNNISLGTFAGNNLINNVDNIFIGKDSGRYCKSSYNTFIGTLSGKSDPNNQLLGASNTCLGHLSGQNIISSAAQNTFIGSYAGFGEIETGLSGSDNVCIGYYSGYKIKNWTYQNTFIGSFSGQYSTTAFGNTFIGYQSGNENLIGYQNTFIGNTSGSESKGNKNTFIGFGAGSSNENGNENTIIGFSANTSGNSAVNQIAIGKGAISKGDHTVVLGNTSITDVFCARNASATLHSTAIMLTETTSIAPDTGFGRLWVKEGATTSDPNELYFTNEDGDDIQITSGSRLNDTNTLDGLTDVKFGGTNFTNSLFIGTNTPGSAPSHGNLNSANNNIGIGFEALKSLTSGEDNVIIGNNSGKKITSSYYNLLLGSSVGAKLDGDYNVFMGYETAKECTTGYNNVAIGYQSSVELTTGYDNVFIGSGSGSETQDGYSNVCIGASTSASSFNAENQIVIGYNVTGVGDNSVTLGNGNILNVYCAEDSSATLNCGNIKVAPDSTIVAEIGKAKIGDGNSDRAVFSHFDCAGDTSSYALAQTNSGVTTLNAKEYQSIDLAINGSSVISVLSSNITLGYNFDSNGRVEIRGKVVIGESSPRSSKLTIEGSISMKEQASADSYDSSYGQLWVKEGATTSDPNELYFTNENGDDIQITSGTGLNASSAISTVTHASDNRVATFSGANSLNGETNLIFDGTNLGIGVASPSQQLEVSNKIKSKGMISNITASNISNADPKIINFTTSVNFYFTMENGPFTTNFSSPTTSGTLQGQSGQIFIKNDATNPSTITWEVDKGWCFESDSGGNIIVPNITGVAGAIDVFNYIILEDSATAGSRRILITKASHFQHYT